MVLIKRLAPAALALFAGVFFASGAWADGAPVSITLLHTNDVHSHFRSDKSPLALGGLARLRTAILAARAAHPDSLLLDGGDWSEGQIYYVEGAGAESLKLMDLLGYDAAVVGNHDWLNGPDMLLDAIAAASPRLSLVGANFDLTKYSRASVFSAAIAPYTIRAVHGVRVAFVGLANYDPLYGAYLTPVKALDPGPVAQRLSHELKSLGLADVVVGISHNALAANQAFLKAAPEMDLIIGAHDHQKLLHPVVVARPGYADAWVVETGKWGQYLGQVSLLYTPAGATSAGHLELKQYQLTQIDRSVAEDAEVKARIDELEARIESRLGPVFHDHIADTDDEIDQEGYESLVGDLVADAYRDAAGADISIELNRFVYDELHAGALNSADFFNLAPPIYNFSRGKSWTLHTWTMKGSNLLRLFKVMYMWKLVTNTGGLSFSGLEIQYDPTAQKDSPGIGDVIKDLLGRGALAVRSITSGGQPIDPDRVYKIAASGGIVQVLQAIDKKVFGFLPVDRLTDTGLEDWGVVRDYVRGLSPLNARKINFGGRISTLQFDLGVVPGSFRWTALANQADGSILARVEVAVRNYGGQASPLEGASVDISSNANGCDASVDPLWTVRGASRLVRSLAPGESQSFVWAQIVSPSDHGLVPLLAFVHTQGESNLGNNGKLSFFMP